MNKPKRDPEKELFRRKAIDFTLGFTLIAFFGAVAVLMVLVCISWMIEILPEFVSNISDPALEPVRNLFLAFFLFIIGIQIFYWILKYSVWNHERIEELERIDNIKKANRRD